MTHDLLQKIKERHTLYVDFNKTQTDTNSYNYNEKKLS